MVGRVTEILLDKYIVDMNDERIEARVRGNVKKKSGVIVGDFVELERVGNEFLINKVNPRKNSVIRPPVANIDQMIIVISANNPMPDYTLLDMQLAFCFSNEINPVICVNKIDIDDGSVEYIKNVYEKLKIKVEYVSAKNMLNLESLIADLNGKISAFSGNSGVGKSSIIKSILKNEDILIGDIASKTNRGKHTTKYVKLYKLNEGSYIFDTPGFSSYELYNIEHKKLKEYYPEFFDCICEYDDCRHVIESEKVCNVKSAVKSGKIDKGRYERYVYIYNKLKENYERRYK